MLSKNKRDNKKHIKIECIINLFLTLLSGKSILAVPKIQHPIKKPNTKIDTKYKYIIAYIFFG